MTEHYPLLVVAPVAGLAIDCVMHVISARVLAGKGPYLPLMAGIATGLLATAGLSLGVLVHDHAALGDLLALIAMNLTAYLALAFGYFNFVNLTVASLRIRMLEELLDSPAPTPHDRLLERYDTGHVASLRLDRLVGGGHLVEEGGRLHSGKRQFLIVARVFDAMRWFVLGPKYCAALRAVRQTQEAS